MYKAILPQRLDAEIYAISRCFIDFITVFLNLFSGNTGILQLTELNQLVRLKFNNSKASLQFH